jgi:hypothetical protein
LGAAWLLHALSAMAVQTQSRAAPVGENERKIGFNVCMGGSQRGDDGSVYLPTVRGKAQGPVPRARVARGVYACTLAA